MRSRRAATCHGGRPCTVVVARSDITYLDHDASMRLRCAALLHATCIICSRPPAVNGAHRGDGPIRRSLLVRQSPSVARSSSITYIDNGKGSDSWSEALSRCSGTQARPTRRSTRHILSRSSSMLASPRHRPPRLSLPPRALARSAGEQASQQEALRDLTS